jgi:competence protein ComEA
MTDEKQADANHAEPVAAQPTAKATESALPSLPPNHRFLKTCLFAAMLMLTGQWLWLSAQRPEPLPWQHGSSFTNFFQVDVNNATWVEWIQLKGIGETMAHRIVAERDINGPFDSVDDLLRVNGIGPSTLEKIRPWLTIGPRERSRSE